jgi:WD40 repeat protein
MLLVPGGAGISVFTGHKSGRVTYRGASAYGDANTHLAANLRHPKAPVSAMAMSDDHRFLAVAGKDKSVCLWKPNSTEISGVTDYNLVGKPLSHPYVVHAMKFSPNGELLLTSCDEDMRGEVRLWNTADATMRGTPYPQTGPAAIAFAPDSSTFATGDNSDIIKLWKVPMP